MPTCRVPGCAGPTSTYGALCNRHELRHRRHGDVYQTALSKTELRPYIALVRNRKDRNPDNPAFPAVVTAWLNLVEDATARVAASERGEAMNRHNRIVAYEIAKLGQEVEPDVVAETGLALFMIWEMDPHRFRSDRAFRHQLVRCIRRLAKSKSTYIPKEGAFVSGNYILPPKATAKFADLLTAAFGGAGVMLARKERADVEARRKNREELAQGLAELV